MELFHDQGLDESFPKQLVLFIFSKCIQNRFTKNDYAEDIIKE
jgi:hypothetical protein